MYSKYFRNNETMSISQLIRSQFPTALISGKVIKTSEEGGVMQALGVLDLMIKNIRNQRISPYFNADDTRKVLCNTLRACEEPVGNLHYLSYASSWNALANRVESTFDEDSDLLIKVFMLVKGVFFKVNDEVEGEYLRLGTELSHEELDINLVDSGDGWLIKLSFAIED